MQMQLIHAAVCSLFFRRGGGGGSRNLRPLLGFENPSIDETGDSRRVYLRVEIVHMRWLYNDEDSRIGRNIFDKLCVASRFRHGATSDVAQT